MKYCQIVMGPAGTGKSTYCKVLQEHCANLGRSMFVGNLDPAAETFGYEVGFDVRDLISVGDVMDELALGPNGGLIYCMEYLSENLDWLEENLNQFGEDDYLLLDCPGQVELYSHVPVMKRVVEMLQAENFNVCGVYLIDATFVTDASKLIAGNLAALSAMVHLELPHVNVLTKCDLVSKDVWRRYLSPSASALAAELSRSTDTRFRGLNKAIASILDDFSMVAFVPLDPTEEDSVEVVLSHVDRALQYGEDMEPKGV